MKSLYLMVSTQSATQKVNFDTYTRKSPKINCKNIPWKNLFNFVNLPTISSPRLQITQIGNGSNHIEMDSWPSYIMANRGLRRSKHHFLQ